MKTKQHPLLNKFDRLAAQGRAALFDAVSVLVEAARLKIAALDVLDEKAKSLVAIPVSELEQMLIMFPKKLQWTGGNLAAMREEMWQKIMKDKKVRTAANKKKEVKTVRHTCTVRELNEANAQIAALVTENDNLKRENVLLRSQVETLQKAVDSMSRRKSA